MKRMFLGFVAAIVAIVGVSCSSSSSGSGSSTEGAHAKVDSGFGRDVDTALSLLKARDPSSAKFFQSCHGYAVFPNVGKGGLIIGGAHGTGHVFEQNRLHGVSELSQATIGLQIGGQEYSEIIFFKDKESLDHFCSGTFEFSGQASAVAVRAGASTDTDYSRGVAIFTMTKGGLMAEASVGGQRFTFHKI